MNGRKNSIIFITMAALLPCGFCRGAFTADDERLLEEISRASFQFFWKEANPVSGLVRDRTGKNVCSVASLGFGLAALPIGVERGYVSYDEAKSRALNALRTLENSNAHYKGVFCHFIDLATGNTTKLGYEGVTSTIDTALMIAGTIVAGEYFGGEVKSSAERIFARVNWAAYVNPENGQVYMAYDMGEPGKFEKQTWDWYTDETLLISLLGQAAPNSEYRLSPETMTNWNRPVGTYKNGEPYIYSYPGTLFTYMFAHCFYDFKQTGKDSLGVDWFENTRRAVIANRDWCRDHSSEYAGYGENLWGITAGSGPKDTYVVLGHEPRGAKDNQGQYGTLHPYGAGMSVPFAAADAMNALREMRNLKVDGKAVWQSPEDGGYGFWDGFNIDKHWVSDNVIGIAQGPMLLLIENARSGLIWKLMMKNNNVRQGLARAGFKGDFKTGI
ncbi:MAG: glucoamylase family protein [Phycisphaerae bacterium]